MLHEDDSKIVLIDDVHSYGIESADFGASARAWAHFLSREQRLRRLVVVAGVQRNVFLETPVPGRAAHYMSDTAITLSAIARTGSHPGMVAEASLMKHRAATPEKCSTVLLWLRPRHDPPMTLA
jgi:hypothetical protein